MRKLVISSILILLSAVAIAQGGWITPNNSYGSKMHRIAPDSTLFYPTGCGSPALHAYDLKQSSLYYDSCGKICYVYDPATATWSNIASAGSTNSNIGSGYRLAVPGTNNIKSVFGDMSIVIDSSNHSGALTFRYFNDVSSPPPFYYYGTDGDGVKGWHPLPLTTPIAVRSSSITLTISISDSYEKTYVFTGSSAGTWTLPAIGTLGQIIRIKNAGTATITIQRAGSNQIFNTSAITSINILPGDSRMFQDDGVYWTIL